MLAFNEVTRKVTAAIDLKKVIEIKDCHEVKATEPPQAVLRTFTDDCDTIYGIDRSFMLVFPNKQEIAFFADTDQGKSKWCVRTSTKRGTTMLTCLSCRLDVLRSIVCHIPPNPLWAELIWQRHRQMNLSDTAASSNAQLRNVNYMQSSVDL